MLPGLGLRLFSISDRLQHGSCALLLSMPGRAAIGTLEEGSLRAICEEEEVSGTLHRVETDWWSPVYGRGDGLGRGGWKRRAAEALAWRTPRVGRVGGWATIGSAGGTGLRTRRWRGALGERLRQLVGLFEEGQHGPREIGRLGP
jgi:hypothetical protein